MNHNQVEYMRLGPDELVECQRLGDERNRFNVSRGIQTQKISKRKSDPEISMEGIIGEYAVLRALGLGGFANIATDGADKRGDIALPTGDFIEVKSSGRAFGDFLIEGGDIQTLFQAAYGVAVWIMPPQASSVLDLVPFVEVGVVGWCDKHLFNIRKRWFGDPMPRPTWGVRWFDLEPLDGLRDHMAWFPVGHQLTA